MLKLDDDIMMDMLMSDSEPAQAMRAALKNALPLDSRLIRRDYDILTARNVFLIQSRDFDEVKEGVLIPELVVTVNMGAH